jgi:uncharacterized membrane protein YecN with MAPEG domain
VPHVSISLFYGCINILILTALGANVSRVRVAAKKFISTDAPDANLFRIIRAHGNATEWTPALVVMLLLLELSGCSANLLHIFGASSVAARVLHGSGVLLKNPISTVGATITYILLFGMPLYGLMLYFHG